MKVSVFFRRVLVLWMMWFIASVCSYGNDLNSTNIVGNLYLNQVLFSSLIAISKIVFFSNLHY